MSKIKVGLVQINNSYSGQSYLPYSVGLLQAYIQKHSPIKDQIEFLPSIYSRAPAEESSNTLIGCDVVGFSGYVWNIRLSLEVARLLKQKSPKTLIVFGGPQVPDSPEAFLRKNPFIDFVVHGEGEVVFCQLMEKLKNREWESLDSVSFITPNGEIVSKPKAPRMADLSAVPSPYLTNVFDPIIKANPKERWIVVWETNRGCPFSCTYCDWGSATQARVYQFEMDRLFQEVDWFAKHKVPFIFCADANFGILNRDYDIAAKVAEIKQTTGYPETLSVQNTKNATDKAYKVQKLLAESGLTRSVTISYQSTDETTLKNIKRANISQKFFKDLQSRFASDKISTYTDIILGLPGETYDSFSTGVSQVIEDGQHNRIVFNNLSILPNAEMGNPEYQKKFGLETIQNEVVYIRGSINKAKDEISEVQDLVISTGSMPRPEWVKTRAFAWMTNFLHFLKTLQIPNVILHEVFGLTYKEIFEIFTENKHEDLKTLNEVKNYFIQKAKDIQEKSDYEFCPSEKWLGIYWPADEYVFINLCADGKLNAFYEDAEKAISRYLNDKFDKVPAFLIQQAIYLNKNLMKLPFQNTDTKITLTYDLWNYYRAVLMGEKTSLNETKTTYKINRSQKTWSSWEDWCREVVWYGNKNASYLYGVDTEPTLAAEPQIAGHH